MKDTLARLLVSDTSESAEPIFTGGFLRGTSIWSLFFTSSRSMSPLSLAYPDELSRCRSTSVSGAPVSAAGAARGGVSAMLLSTSRLSAPGAAAAEPVTDSTTAAPERDDRMSEPDCFNSMFSYSSPLTMTGEPTNSQRPLPPVLPSDNAQPPPQHQLTLSLCANRQWRAHLITIMESEKMCSHTDLQTHAHNALDNPVTLTFYPQGQCMPRACHGLYICRLWFWQHESFFFLLHGQTDRLNSMPETSATNHHHLLQMWIMIICSTAVETRSLLNKDAQYLLNHLGRWISAAFYYIWNISFLFEKSYNPVLLQKWFLRDTC